MDAPQPCDAQSAIAAGARRGLSDAGRLIKNWAEARSIRAVTEFVGTTSPGIATPARATASIESRQSWIAAWVTFGLLSVCFGSTLTIVVGLKPITEDLGTTRQLVALAGALTWFGTGLGR